MLKVNTVSILTPSTFKVILSDLDKAGGTYITASGTLVRERKRARRRKLMLTYRVLTQSELSTLLQQIADESFTVEYPDPYDGSLRSSTFYVGDRDIDTLEYEDGTPMWKDVRFNFVEY
jgi:hypothetical protein